MPVAFAPEAVADLTSIRTYISQNDPAAVSRVAVRLVAACDSLETRPHMGRPGQVAGTRELSRRPYLIVYRVTAGAVEIVRIWHMSQHRPLP
jgi:toxin ParE1/3/4